MVKKGPLSKKDKEIISESASSKTVEELAKSLNRAEATVKKYIDKIKEQKPKKASLTLDQFARNDRGSTVMTKSASERAEMVKKTGMPTRTRQCVTSIREVHNKR